MRSAIRNLYALSPSLPPLTHECLSSRVAGPPFISSISLISHLSPIPPPLPSHLPSLSPSPPPSLSPSPTSPFPPSRPLPPPPSLPPSPSQITAAFMEEAVREWRTRQLRAR
ncbi:uncharacterized protein SCHCODRAFT_02305863 [Schizophyllum commune H4-8]|uniref:uncharacterized protein n=1 Tax=Schizophyllum commune (strain H4-8 / FGSC 9210) TaxID=578458 RepID=UPI00215EEEDC|nr:uncharacterized protein SCHCODRAFT_02305863 [Schizophyllum commune H4-8]KAI5890901.1 hypothetical protein SCHCODRAFT_02305863 [Schizophyllum commune H4-8]